MLAQVDERPVGVRNDHLSMRQLTSLDAQFLAMENGRTQGHVSILGVFDPTPNRDARSMRHSFGSW